MKKTIVAIGGGELKTKETLAIDRMAAALAAERAGEKRPLGVFIGTASHDSMPYFNSFRKTYTSVLGMKADVALTVYGEMDLAKIREKIALADLLYVGGGDTLYMMEKWRTFGLLPLIREAYERGTILCGLSAGAICWFTDMYTDSEIDGVATPYSLQKGLGWIPGLACPHYDDRCEDFDAVMKTLPDGTSAYGIENRAALILRDGLPDGGVSCGGRVVKITSRGGTLEKEVIVDAE